MRRCGSISKVVVSPLLMRFRMSSTRVTRFTHFTRFTHAIALSAGRVWPKHRSLRTTGRWPGTPRASRSMFATSMARPCANSGARFHWTILLSRSPACCAMPMPSASGCRMSPPWNCSRPPIPSSSITSKQGALAGVEPRRGLPLHLFPNRRRRDHRPGGGHARYVPPRDGKVRIPRPTASGSWFPKPAACV